MKKLLSALILFCCTYQAGASHLMGGEITARQVSGTDYLVTLKYYRDVIGIPMDTSQFVHVYDDLGNMIDMDPSTPSVIDGVQLAYDTVLSAQLLPGYPYQVEAYLFRDVISFPSAGEFKIVKAHCCRNAALINIQNSASENMYISTNVTVFASQSNSTPDFLAPPVIWLPAYTPWQYNPVPFDSDGDSLAWSLYVPLSTGPTDIPQPTANPVIFHTDLVAFSDASGPFSLDPQSGVISWVANTLGNFQAAVLIEEYRNGVKIGEVMRDMQFIVTSTSNPPSITNIDTIAPQDVNGYRQLNLTAGQPYQANLRVNNPGGPVWATELFLFAYGGPMIAPTNPATLTTAATGNGHEIEGVFNWTPDNAAADLSPFILNFRSTDGLLNYDETIIVNVQHSSTGIEDPISANTVNVYPNPGNGVFTISLEGRQPKTTAKVVNAIGQTVYQSTSTLREQNVINLTHLPKGMYFLVLENEAGRTSKKLVIQH
jgi:hypothetical protein